MLRVRYSAEVETESKRFENDERFKRLAHDFCFSAHMHWYEKRDQRSQKLKEYWSRLKEYQGKAMLEPMPIPDEVPVP